MKKIAWVPLPISIAVVVILNSSLPRVLPADMVFEPPLLFPISSLLFISCITVFAAYVAAKAYSRSGIIPLAILGASTLAFGLGALLASWLSYLPSGGNLNSTVGNVRCLLSSILALLSVTSTMVGLTSERTGKKLRLHVTILYAAVSSFLILLTIAAIQGVTPPFYTQGVGYTPLRQIMVETTILLFIVSSLQMIISYFRSKEKFMYWGSAGFALTAIGSYGLFFLRSAGDPIAWTSRITQFVGCIWLLIGLLPDRGSGAKKQQRLNRSIQGEHK